MTVLVQIILGNDCIFFRAVQLFFIMDICNKGNYITICSTELNKLPVYHKVCNPSPKDTVWGVFD